jgi:hypothetical protein
VPTINWYLTATTDGGWRTIDEATQSAGKNTDGWVVSTGATNHSAYEVGVERAATTFANTTPPSGTLNTTLYDAFRTTDAYTGDFASGNWSFIFSVQATTNGGAQDGRIIFRLIKADADGSNATEITSGQQAASLLSNVATTGTFESSLTLNPGAINLAGQHLFVQIAWERTGAGGMTTSDINWIRGSSTTVGTRIASTNFTPGATLLTPDRFDNTSTFYSPDVTQPAGVQDLLPTLVTNTSTFYGPTVGRGAVTLSPARYDNDQAFYAPTVAPGAVLLSPPYYENPQAFYAATVSQPGGVDVEISWVVFDTQGGNLVNLLPNLYTNDNTFYPHVAVPGQVGLTVSRYDNANQFFAAVLSQGGVVLQPDLLTNANTFYTATVASGAVNLSPARYDNAQTFYGPAVNPGAVALSPARFDNAQTFYASVVNAGVVFLNPARLDNEQTFFAALLTQAGGGQQVLPDVLINLNQFFGLTATTSDTLTASRYDNTNTFFTHLLLPDGYPNPADVRFGVTYGPGGIYVGTLIGGSGSNLIMARRR